MSSPTPSISSEMLKIFKLKITVVKFLLLLSFGIFPENVYISMHSSLYMCALFMSVYNADLRRNLHENGEETEDKEENRLMEKTLE